MNKELASHCSGAKGIDWEMASQVVLVVKNLPDNEGDIRDPGSILGLE